jgi:hypothetical protein
MSTASRAVLAAVVCALIAAAVVWRQPLRRALVAFFSEESGPFNLAVFRIVFFSVALVTLPDRRVVAQYAQLPHALIFAPHNLGKVLANDGDDVGDVDLRPEPVKR